MSGDVIFRTVVRIVFIMSCLTGSTALYSYNYIHLDDKEESSISFKDVAYDYELINLTDGKWWTNGNLTIEIKSSINTPYLTLFVSKPYKFRVYPDGIERPFFYLYLESTSLAADSVAVFEYKNATDGIYFMPCYILENETDFVYDYSQMMFINDYILPDDLQLLNCSASVIEDCDDVVVRSSDGKVTISSDSRYLDIALYSMTGNLVMTESTSSNMVVLPTAELPHGVYILRITAGDSILTKKIRL